MQFYRSVTKTDSTATLGTPSAAGDLTPLEPLLSIDDFAKKVPTKKRTPKKPATSPPVGLAARLRDKEV